MGFPCGEVVKNPLANAGDARDVGLIPGSRSPGVGNGNLLPYACLDNSMGRRARWATLHGVTKELDTHTQTHTHLVKTGGYFFKTLVKKKKKDSGKDCFSGCM